MPRLDLISHDAVIGRHIDGQRTPCWAHRPPLWQQMDCEEMDCKLHDCGALTDDPLGLCGRHRQEVVG